MFLIFFTVKLYPVMEPRNYLLLIVYFANKNMFKSTGVMNTKILKIPLRH